MMTKKFAADRIRIHAAILLRAVQELQADLPEPKIGPAVLELIETELETCIQTLGD